jgi:hypothetical protein
MRAGRVFVLIVLAFLPAAATQGSPPPLATQIRLVGPAEGFVAVAEVVTPQGAVIDTFRSVDVTFKVIGSPGSKVKAGRVAERVSLDGLNADRSGCRNRAKRQHQGAKTLGSSPDMDMSSGYQSQIGALAPRRRPSRARASYVLSTGHVQAIARCHTD